MAVSLASFVLLMVAARELTGRMSTMEILAFRSLVALLVLLALWPRLGRDAFRTRRLSLHVARNIVHFCGQYAWIWGIAVAPLAVVTAIEFTTPVWVALLAAAFLGERISGPRSVAIVAGVAGILTIVRPGIGAFEPSTLVILAGAFCYAVAILLVKALLRTDRATAVIFYMSLIQLPLGFAGALFAWVWPIWRDVPWLVAIGVTSLAAHYAMARALSLGDASFVLPIDFLRLPCVALAALILYREPIDVWTLLGAAVIFAGNYWSVRHEAARGSATGTDRPRRSGWT